MAKPAPYPDVDKAKFDAETRDDGRSVCLVLDNCSAHHIEDLELTNVELKFLPPNCTSLIQLLDRGIINSVKCSYWRRLIDKLLLDLRLKCQTKVDIFQALEMLSASWKDTAKEVLKNCFRKAGFETPTMEEVTDDSIVKDVLNESEDEDSEADTEDLCEVLSSRKVLDAIDVLRRDNTSSSTGSIRGILFLHGRSFLRKSSVFEAPLDDF
ncbi:hypothetical protein HPB47_002210 [Ixodes persulcatus]|uniref:Uncharacterized protein n=1 Tax=Ixodes persulcatus TaxID=34615 RepID=A0AC60PNE6_IXOPE|nr:hypothetical protein HPB47_002210 [Ixodes persulcatus]